MIGRDEDLAALDASLRVVREQRMAHVVTIVGDAGVGKSRLLEEFMGAVDRDSANVWLFRGRAGQEPGRRPYALLRDLLAHRFAIHDGDRAAEARQKLEQGLVGFIGPAGAELAPFIGHLIGFDYAASPQLHGILDNARQLRDRALHALAALFAAVTEDHPAMVCLEDIHWADDSSLDAIEYLFRACEQLPVLFVVLARPALFERRPSWGGEPTGHLRLQLRPLNEAESRSLAGALLRQIPQLPAALLNLVVSRAEGNPFYLEELITMLIEDGVIIAGTDEWRVAPERLAGARVPATLTGVLQARIDALPAGERATLQRASVIGRVFWDAAVARLGDRNSSSRPADPRATRDMASILRTLGDLEALRAKGLTVLHPASAFAGTQEHLFKHALLHQVSYNSVTKRQRRQYHTQAGEWLIERSGERVGEYAALIAEHFELAGDHDRAADWYARAAHQAQAIYAAGLAIEYYRKVLALLPSGPGLAVADAMRRAAAHEGLGEMLLWQGRYDEAAACYTDMRAAAELARDAVAQARAWYGLAEVRVRQGDFPAALDSAGQVERIAEAGGAHTELAMALLLQGWCLLQLGKPQAALGLGEAVLLLATEHDALREMARGSNLLGAIHKALGDLERAAASMRAGLELHRELGDRLRVVGTLNNLGLIAEEQGDYAAAAQVYHEAVGLAREIKDAEFELQSLGNLGGARVRLGSYDAGAADLRQALRLAETVGLAELARFYCRLAEANLGQDDPIGALVALQQAFELAQAYHDDAALALAWRVLGQVLSQPAGRAAQRAAALALPKPAPDAEACFAESERIFGELGMSVERARTLYALARHRLDRGDLALGQPLWREVRAVFARLGMHGDLARLERAP